MSRCEYSNLSLLYYADNFTDSFYIPGLLAQKHLLSRQKSMSKSGNKCSACNGQSECSNRIIWRGRSVYRLVRCGLVSSYLVLEACNLLICLSTVKAPIAQIKDRKSAVANANRDTTAYLVFFQMMAVSSIISLSTGTCTYTSTRTIPSPASTAGKVLKIQLVAR